MSIRLTHLQMLQSTETVKLSKLVMWPIQPVMFGCWQNSSRSIYFSLQGKKGVYILPHKIIITCEIIFFVYVAWRKVCTVMSFSYSLKIFGWRQNTSRSVYFASWGKIDADWVIQKYLYRQWKIKNIGIGPKKAYWSSSTLYSMCFYCFPH